MARSTPLVIARANQTPACSEETVTGEDRCGCVVSFIDVLAPVILRSCAVELEHFMMN